MMNAVASLPGPLFDGVPDAARAALAAAAARRRLGAGQTLFHEGDEAAQLFVVEQGRVRIWRSSPGGTPVTVHVMGPGEVPGCVASFARSRFPANATALDDSVVLSWPAKVMGEWLAATPALAANALTIVGHRNMEMLDRLQDAATEAVAQRVARTLLRVAHDGLVTATRQQIAELSATTLHSVSRLVSRWTRDGVVAGRRGAVAIVDAIALAELAHGAREKSAEV